MGGGPGGGSSAGGGDNSWHYRAYVREKAQRVELERQREREEQTREQRAQMDTLMTSVRESLAGGLSSLRTELTGMMGGGATAAAAPGIPGAGLR